MSADKKNSRASGATKTKPDDSRGLGIALIGGIAVVAAAVIPPFVTHLLSTDGPLQQTTTNDATGGAAAPSPKAGDAGTGPALSAPSQGQRPPLRYTTSRAPARVRGVAANKAAEATVSVHSAERSIVAGTINGSVTQTNE